MPLVLIPFGVLAAGLFLIAYAHTASAHQGAATAPKRSGGILGALTFVLPILAPLEKGVKRAVDWALNSVRGWVSHWALAHVKAVARWFVGLHLLVHRASSEHKGLANDTANSLQKMRWRIIPHAVQVGVAPVKAAARTANRHAETALTREKALSSSVARTHRAQVKLNVHYTHAIDVTLPRDIRGIRTREEALSRDQAALRERTTSLENGALKTWEWMRGHAHSLATDAFAGAVAIALTSLGYGFLRCRGWKGLGSRLSCGMGRLLEDLLFGLIDVLVIADLCQITRLMIDTAESSVVQGTLRSFVAGIDDLLLCQGVGLPPALEGYWTALPPAQSFSALPAV